jgi:DNA adenine methylase
MKHIAPYFPATFTEFRDVFTGGGHCAMYAKSNQLAQKYWMNDLYRPLINFWQVLRNPLQLTNLVVELESYLPYSLEQKRALFDIFKQEIKGQYFPAAASHYAACFFFLNRCSFSGTVEMGGFSSSAAVDRFTQSAIDRIKKLPSSLAGVRITCSDFQPVIEEDGEDVLLMVDPPYCTVKGIYSHAEDLHERLAQCLRETKHKFLATYDDCKEIRDLYSWANISPLDLQYSMVGKDAEGKRRVGKEIVIRNY